MIDGDTFEGLDESVRPVHFHADRGMVSEAEMQAGIVAGIKTGLTQNALRLRFPAVMGKNPGTGRASIGLDPLKLHLNPILFSPKIVA